jgi:hypothetical protein
MVSQSLAFRAQHGFSGTLFILYAKLRAVVVSEIELSKIAAQMSLAD